MKTKHFIAKRTCPAVDANGREFTLELGIGQPYELSDVEWACPVSLDAIHDQLPDIHGVDSWEAMQLAYQLIALILNDFIQKGGKLYWPESQEEITLPQLIPNLPTLQ